MGFLKRLFRGRGDPRVSTLLRGVYDSADERNRAALKRHLSSVPSGCEIVATFHSASAADTQKVMQAVYSRLGELPFKGSAVYGVSAYPDGFVAYVKGDLSDDLYISAAGILGTFANQYKALTPAGEKAPSAEVYAGRPDPDTLEELP
jgi:hypothetical protein